VDFAHYKFNTLQRRITRRMLLQRLDALPDYVRVLESDSAELDALYSDILISVTSFFRNPESYEVLKDKVFPGLAGDRSRHEPVRVWTLGCSTGEEAYSLAMAYTEYLEAEGKRVPMQIFATDLNGAGIDKARAGIYSKGVAQDMSPERLRRFFLEVDGSYRISKPIRDMCTFARQNVLSDPPFSRIDLITCRNLLIYLEPVLQQKLIPMLHYSLRSPGYLWLGASETIGSYRDLFEPLDAEPHLCAQGAAASVGVAQERPACGNRTHHGPIRGPQRQTRAAGSRPRPPRALCTLQWWSATSSRSPVPGRRESLFEPRRGAQA
jgi:two-component system CheB/CheR fusion protein